MKRLIITFILSLLIVTLYSATLTIQTSTGEETIELNEINSIEFFQDRMIYVEGGTYDMGDHYNEGWSDELPVHSVTVNDFQISKYEVTHAEFIAFLNNRNVTPEGIYNGNELIDLNDNDCVIEYSDDSFIFTGNEFVQSIECPVLEITWFGACEYSNWLCEVNNLPLCYEINTGNVECDFNATGYRLPTEAEWEYAARGGINWTNEFRYSGCHNVSDLFDYAWYEYNLSLQVHPIGLKLPNQLGIHDMSGNVYEFCWDWFSSSYYEVSPTDNPLGPQTGSYHVSRGGDWNDSADFVRSAARFSSYPYLTGGYLGFRIIRANP